MIKRIYTIVISVFFVCLCAQAIPAKPGIIKVQQPDGSEVNIRLYGDEFFSYATTEDGYLIKSVAGQWEYAKWDGEKAVSIGVKAKDAVNRDSNDDLILGKIKPFALSASRINALRNKSISLKNMSSPSNRTPNEVAKGLVVLVNFSDKVFKSATPKADFDSLLNEDGYSENGAIGSARNYFQDMSYNTYNPHFDVFGPVTLDQNMAYYGAPDEDSNDARPAQMVVDAMAKLMASAEAANIDLSDYDGDGDGNVDNIFVFYAGNAQSSGAHENTIWPHKWGVYIGYNAEGEVEYQGKTISMYACASELRGISSAFSMTGIGTFCHEFTHVLGLPDIYDTDYSGHKTSGKWDIMDSGGHNGDGCVPAAYTAYERFFMDWVKPTILNTAGEYTLDLINESDSGAYIITNTGSHNFDAANPNPAVYFTLESRAQEGWDAFIPGNGMLITKIQYNNNTWESNTVNNDPNNMGVDIIEADGNVSSDHIGKQGDAFPVYGRVDSYTPYTQYPITEIVRFSDGTINFAFIGKKYTVSFDSWDYGMSVDSILTETEPFAGVVLPGVVVESGYTFEGWSSKRSASTVDVGLAGETYNPTAHITLYAVYSQGGEIVERDFGCFIETFNGLGEKSDQNIAGEIGELADNDGWKGDNLYRDNGAVYVKGSITTPELNINGMCNIYLRARGSKIGKIYVDVVGNGTVDTEELKAFSSFKDYNIVLRGCDYTTKLKFTSSSNELGIDSMEICKSTNTAAERVDFEDIMIVNNEMVVGLESGDNIMCVDMHGRILWTETTDTEAMCFEAPEGVYLLTVLRDGQYITLKSVKL